MITLDPRLRGDDTRKGIPTYYGAISLLRSILMNTHFFLSIGLVMIAISLCYWYRNEK